MAFKLFRLSGLLLIAAALAVSEADTVAGQEPASSAQSSTDASDLQRLIAEALTANPSLQAAQDRVEAARAAVEPASALPDPMLMAGVMNFPVTEPGFEDFMTMKTIGVGQLLPYPGKLELHRTIAEHELAAASARAEAARLAVVADVEEAYYQLAYLDRSMEIVRRNEDLLSNFIRVSESRYGVGTGAQADVLKARVEASRLAEEAVSISERRRGVLARLNAAVGRPTEAPVDAPLIPIRTARLAVAEEPGEIRFVSGELGSRAADSPLPPLAELQDLAVARSPVIRAHEAMIAAQAARVELARMAHLPDFDISLQYGQRSGRSDMLSATVSVPIPLRRRSKQNLAIEEAEARLSALQAEHHQHANMIRAAVAEGYSDLERDRAQLALFVKSILPQGRAALESATAGFQVGRVDFLTLLENQATLYNYESQYYRALSDFAAGMAELEQTVGGEVIR